MEQGFSQRNPSALKQFLQRHVTGIDIGAAVVIVLLVMTSVVFYLRYDQLKMELNSVREKIETSEQNRDVLDFTQMFMEKVLRAEGEINFETRLQLEGAVRSLNDAEILSAWETFTTAPTEAAAQIAVRNLLSLLIAKVR